jgi:Ribonuclease G/E
MQGADPVLGLILRSAAFGADETEIAEDIAQMRALGEALMADDGKGAECLLAAATPHETAWREWGDPAPDAVIDEVDGFAEEGVLDAVDALRYPRVDLPGGSSAYVEPTRALVAVDVNTGGDSSAAAGLKANVALARELPRQLRLRGLGGQITIDFAPMPKRDRKVLEQTLTAAFRADSVETSLVGWTPLGHYELQRKRERLPLTEVLSR